MVDMGFETGKASPCTFKLEEKGLMCFVHGDDFVASGELSDITWMRERPEEKYQIKVNIIGEAPELEKEGRILNRIIRWHPGRGVSYEADPRHAEEIIKATGADKLTAVRTPMVKEAATEAEDAKMNDINDKKSKGELGKKKKKKKKKKNEPAEATMRLGGDRRICTGRVANRAWGRSSPTTATRSLTT